MKPEEEALEICQKIGMTTMFTDCNEGMTLPLEISQKIAIMMCEKILSSLEEFNITSDINEHKRYWNEVKKEIDLI